MHQQDRSVVDSVTVEPAWGAWERALDASKHTQIQQDDRALLGIPAGPVVMSGHQPTLFHPGIVAKVAALMHAAEQTGAHPVWIVPDQDAMDVSTVRVPVGRGAELVAKDVRLFAAAEPQVPLCSLPAVDEIARGLPAELDELAQRLEAYAFEDSLARQFGNAIVELACEWLGVDTPTVVFASDLVRMESFGVLIDAMEEDPQACVDAYNSAAAEFPDAGVRELTTNDGRIELPLWRVRAKQKRTKVYADELAEIPREELLPRGLMMTAVVRSVLCELFIHGTGGWNYDRITEAWMRAWRGVELSPMAHVTATQRLDLGGDEGAVDPDRAAWEAHHARHNPAMVGDTGAADEKAKLVEQIKQHKRDGVDPSGGFGALQTLLVKHREANTEALRALEERAEAAQAHRRAFTLAGERTWAFVLFDEDAGRALMDRVRTEMC